MAEPSPVRRLADTSSNLELWWDSSPLIFEDWVRGMGPAVQEMELFAVRSGAGETT